MDGRGYDELLSRYQNSGFKYSDDTINDHVLKMASTQLILPRLSLSGLSPRRHLSQFSEQIAQSRDYDVKTDIKHSSSYKSVKSSTDSESGPDLKDAFFQAKELLDTSNLEEAEHMFLKLYQQLQDKSEGSIQLLVQTLGLLADICIRRSRMCRSNPLEWQWLCIHAITILQYSSEICQSEIECALDNQEIEWYEGIKCNADVKKQPLEEMIQRALYNSLKPDKKLSDTLRPFASPATPSTPSFGLFPLSATSPQYNLFPGMRIGQCGKKDIDSDEHTHNSSENDDWNIDWLFKLKKYCKARVNSRNLSEIVKNLLKEPTFSQEDDCESVDSDGSCRSLDWDTADMGNMSEMREMEEIDLEQAKIDTPVKEYSFAFEIASSDVDQEGWDFFVDERRDYIFQSVIQMCPDDPEEEDDSEFEKEVDESQVESKIFDKEIVSSIHEEHVSLMLAKIYSKLGDKLSTEERYKLAELLYNVIFVMINNLPKELPGIYSFKACCLKNLGTIKSKQGKHSSGLKLLNKSLQIFRDLHEDEENLDIAMALVELGNGYIVGKRDDEIIYTNVIDAFCEFFELDSSDDQGSASMSSSGHKSPLLDKTEEEISRIEEAIVCYSEALCELYKHKQDTKQTDMVARATMRLGDCHFMKKDYDKALACFEKAFSLFQNISVFGSEFVLGNAHALCMLGVCSFMLYVYPKAASVFQLANHMVKYVYRGNCNFLNGYILALLGISFYKMKNYHKCVSVCYQAFEIFLDLFGDNLSKLSKQKFWLVCQTLYVMGNSYNVLNLHHRAIKYLTIAQKLCKTSGVTEKKQFMRVLQILGDCYFAQYDYRTALSYYNEALEYSQHDKHPIYNELFDLAITSDDMAIHNQLVSKSAEAHISMQQYQNAIHYLEQAHDMQETIGGDIKEDLVSTLHQLGQIHSMAGDVDKAIESFTDSLEVLHEIDNREHASEMCNTLGNLAAMCYVKACICDDIDKELEMILATEGHFQSALSLDMNQCVCVKYANFLYSQGNYDDAILYLDDALKLKKKSPDIVYGGLEKVTLPELIQDEVDAQEEVVIPAECLARYLLVLSHKMMGDMHSAEKHLLVLMKQAIDSEIPLLHSVVGYSLMEFSLFEEAASSFATAVSLEPDYTLAIDNYYVCVLVQVLRTLQHAFENIYIYYGFQLTN